VSCATPCYAHITMAKAMLCLLALALCGPTLADKLPQCNPDPSVCATPAFTDNCANEFVVAACPAMCKKCVPGSSNGVGVGIRARRADAVQPQISTKQGHVFIATAGKVQNITSLATEQLVKDTAEDQGVAFAAAQDELKTVQKTLERRSTSTERRSNNTEDQLIVLVKSLAATTGKLVASVDGMRDAIENSTSIAATTAAVARAAAVASASGSSSNKDCIPYVEYITKDGSCKLLARQCKDQPGTWEKARPTRTSDRDCAKFKTCDLGKTYQVVTPGPFNDRECKKATACDKSKNEVETVAPTLTTDRKCASTGFSSANPGESCLALLKIGLKKSGYYYIKPKNQQSRKTWCDQTHEGGGWTVIARGAGNDRACWMGSNDCNINRLTSGTNVYQLGTARMSDGWISGLTYTRIWYQGTGSVKGNQYTRGKDNPGGGCNYRHWAVSSGQCVCQSVNINMASQGCGHAHSSHRGLGDWPSNGALHTGHVSEWWYFKKARAHNGHNTGYCYGRGYTACDVMLYVR